LDRLPVDSVFTEVMQATPSLVQLPARVYTGSNTWV
jgi:hypothetical protein